MAWKRRSRACFAEHLAHGRVLHGAVGELSGKGRALQEAFAPRQLAGVAGGHPRLRGPQDLAHDGLRLARVFLQPFRELGVDGGFHEAPYLGVAEFRLGLALELGLLQLHADDGRQAFAHVLPYQVVLLLLEKTLLARVVVHHPGECGLQPGEVCPSLVGIDVVGEGVDVLDVALVVLHGDLHLGFFLFRFHEDDLVVQRVLGGVDVLDEVDDPAVVAERDLFRRVFSLVLYLYPEAAVKERHLPHPLRDGVEVDLRALENLRVRGETDDRSGPVCFPDDLEFGHRDAPLIPLLVYLAVPAHLEDEPLGQRVHHGDADTVEPPGDPVHLAAELSAGVQGGQHHFRRGPVLFLSSCPRGLLSRCSRSIQPGTHRCCCPRPRRPGGATPWGPWSLCTCLVFSLPPPVPPEPIWNSRRRYPPFPLFSPFILHLALFSVAAVPFVSTIKLYHPGHTKFACLGGLMWLFYR